MCGTEQKTSVRETTRDALVDRLAEFDTAVEVGIGRNTDVATALAATGVSVTATDIYHREVPGAVTFVFDDITDPSHIHYADADVLYALNLPPELHAPTEALARDVQARFLFTTLGGDPPTIPVRRESLPGATLYVATGLEE